MAHVKRQQRYPFRFIQGDALAPPVDLAKFDLIWASPPCQAFTLANNRDARGKHQNLIPQTRALLIASGVPFVIEIVVAALPFCGEEV